MRTVIILLTLGLASCTADEEKSSKAQSKGGPPPAQVELVEITETSLVSDRTFLGEVRNAESTVLAAGGSGLVTRVPVREGDSVKRGKVLVQLDDSILRAQMSEQESALKRTNVDLEQARRDAERLSKLSETGAVTSAEAERARSTRDALMAAAQGQKASIERVREEIQQMRVVAPVDGVVARRHVSTGQWLTTGTTAIELASQGSLEVHVRIPSQVLDILESNPPVTIVRGEDEMPASVAGIVGRLDPRTRTALLRIVPETAQTWLRENDAVDVTIALERQTEGVVVPMDALVYGIGSTRVFRSTDGKAEPHDVEVVTESGERVLVKAPKLAVGDQIVAKGNERLRPGQPLQVTQ